MNITVAASFTDDDGFSESRTSAQLQIPIPPLHGYFDGYTVPTGHGGANSTIVFQLYFSEAPVLSHIKLRDVILTATNGNVHVAKRVNPSGI